MGPLQTFYVLVDSKTNLFWTISSTKRRYCHGEGLKSEAEEHKKHLWGRRQHTNPVRRYSCCSAVPRCQPCVTRVQWQPLGAGNPWPFCRPWKKPAGSLLGDDCRTRGVRIVSRQIKEVKSTFQIQLVSTGIQLLFRHLKQWNCTRNWLCSLGQEHVKVTYPISSAPTRGWEHHFLLGNLCGAFGETQWEEFKKALTAPWSCFCFLCFWEETTKRRKRATTARVRFPRAL